MKLPLPLVPVIYFVLGAVVADRIGCLFLFFAGPIRDLFLLFFSRACARGCSTKKIINPPRARPRHVPKLPAPRPAQSLEAVQLEQTLAQKKKN